MSIDPEVRRGGNLPFGMVANRWMCDPRYSANARTLYAILVSYADTQSRDTGRGKPYRVELARQLGVSVSTLDRTLDEMEVAGLITVVRRTAPDAAGRHDASLYHLHDAGVMWQGNESWVDPLPPDVLAARVAKARTEERRRAKRDAGITRKGGVPKGVNTRARKVIQEVDHPDTPVVDEQSLPSHSSGSFDAAATQCHTGRGSTDAAIPRSVDAATVAAPVLPNKENLVQNASPDPYAPSARSVADARRASHLSSARCEASGESAPKGRPRGRERHLSPDVSLVIMALPEDLRTVLAAVAGSAAPPALIREIEDQLAERTPTELASRVARRWYAYGYAEKFAEGGLQRPVGAAIAMVRAGKCGHARCEDGKDLDSGSACRACKVRRTDRRAERRHSMPTAVEQLRIPTPRPADACPDCGLPEPGGHACEACRGPAAGAAHTGLEPQPAAPSDPATPMEPARIVRTAIAEPSGQAKALGRGRVERTSCRRCDTKPGRAAWAGLCGPCAANTPAESRVEAAR